MVKEFFVKDWLKKNLFLYGVLHLIITPLILLFLITLTSSSMNYLNFLSEGALLGMTSVMLTGWLYELARKCKGQEEETGDLSYTKIWGIEKSMYILMLSVFVSIGISWQFFKSLGISNFYITLGFVAIGIIFGVNAIRFIKNPCAKIRKNNELLVALLSAYTFLFPIVRSWI